MIYEFYLLEEALRRVRQDVAPGDPGAAAMSDRIQSGLPASLLGCPIVVSEYVPKAEHYEADYSRPLVVRLVHGRTVDLRTWEEDQVFLVSFDDRDRVIMRPEALGVIRGLL